MASSLPEDTLPHPSPEPLEVAVSTQGHNHSDSQVPTTAPNASSPMPPPPQDQSLSLDNNENGCPPPVQRGDGVLTSADQEELNSPHSVFNRWEKGCIVFLASLAGFFSPISANIYFPALTTLSKEYRVSDSLINLTVTVYMIFQGLAPSFTGSLSESIGRRPVYVLCFIIYIGANIGLALQHDFAALLVLRCLQSSGSSGTVALANAVVSDVATAAERGIYIGYASLGGVAGIAIGPIIGGILSDFLGWRSIFWFLVIFAGSVFLVLLLFLPETARGLVDNGAVPPQKWNMCVWDYLPSVKRQRASTKPTAAATTRTKNRRFVNPILTLKICADKEAGIVLLANGLVFAGYYAVASAIPSQFVDIYGFNDLQIGLSFIPIGVGSAISTITAGRAVDWNFARHSRRLGISVEEAKQKNRDVGSFPIESVRCEIALPILALASIALITYGWVLDYRTSLAGPLVMLFVIGYCSNGFFTILSVLMVDVYPQAPATATAANNLVRCWLGAGASVLIIPMVNAMSSGWAYTFIGFMYILLSPLLWIIMRWGPKWRAERIAAEKAREKTSEGFSA